MIMHKAALWKKVVAVLIMMSLAFGCFWLFAVVSTPSRSPIGIGFGSFFLIYGVIASYRLAGDFSR